MNNVQDLPQLFKILRLFGLTMFVTVLLIHGGPYQIGLMLLIYCSHYLIDVYRAYCKKNQKLTKKIKDNEQVIQQVKFNLEEKIENSKFDHIKAEILLRYYKVVEVIFCFILSFYPNFDLRLHFNINGNRILRWRNQINQLTPGSYKK